jgi:hypothetical protein
MRPLDAYAPHETGNVIALPPPPSHSLNMYGRPLADALMADGTNVNHMLVKDGWCWSICPEADNLSTLKGSKIQELGLVLSKPGTTCALAKQPPRLYYGSYLFERQASNEIWGRWYPLCSSEVDGCGALHNKKWNGSSCLAR